MDVKYTFKPNAKWILKTRKDEIFVLSELPLSGEAIVDRFKLDEIGRRFCRLCLNNRRSEINSILKLEHSKRSAIQTGQENRPYYEIEELISALIDNRFNFVKTGIALNLSDNGVRKRLKARGLDKAILSQAKSLLLEGATTTGEVMDFLITRLAPDT